MDLTVMLKNHSQSFISLMVDLVEIFKHCAMSEMFCRFLSLKKNFPIPHLNRYVNEVLRKTLRSHTREILK